jgi:hypothetical protein
VIPWPGGWGIFGCGYGDVSMILQVVEKRILAGWWLFGAGDHQPITAIAALGAMSGLWWRWCVHSGSQGNRVYLNIIPDFLTA